jgi:hypothetical protein
MRLATPVNSLGLGFTQQVRVFLRFSQKGALLNHSCRPNACFFHDNDGIMCFRAVRDIPKGTEICTTYVCVITPFCVETS